MTGQGLDDHTVLETAFRELLPSTERYRMHPHHGTLLVSFGAERDFFAAVRSATGCNIPLEIGWMFQHGKDVVEGIHRCYLCFKLAPGCIDPRLDDFLADLQLPR